MELGVPSPPTSLLILFGASAWPLSPEFQSSEAFANAARGLKAYFLDPQRFGLPVENLLDLFDEDCSVDELDVKIGRFLEQRLATMKAVGNPARDLLLYFIGHGGFVGHDADFYLAIRRTRIAGLRASGMQMAALADTLNEQTRHLRRIIILDCCFAGAAFSAFQSGPAEVAFQKAIDAFEVRYKAIGFPTKGTTLLCSSGHKSPSALLPDGSSTMFTKALLDALSQGTIPIRDRLSLREVKDITADFLHEIKTAPRPEVFSPDQSEGDIADIPFFPNPQAEEERIRKANVEQARKAIEQGKEHQLLPTGGLFLANQTHMPSHKSHLSQVEDSASPIAVWTAPFLGVLGLLFVLTAGISFSAFNFIVFSDHAVEAGLSLCLLLVVLIAGIRTRDFLPRVILGLTGLGAIMAATAFSMQTSLNVSLPTSSIQTIVGNPLLTAGLVLAAVISLLWVIRPFTRINRIVLFTLFGMAVVCTLLQYPANDSVVLKHLLLLVALLTLIHGVVIAVQMERRQKMSGSNLL